MSARAAGFREKLSLSELQFQRSMLAVNAMNEFFNRAEYLKQKYNGNVKRSCNYPDIISLSDYKNTYDRNGIGTRVVQLYPEESWMLDPKVKENPDPSKTTRWERKWEELLFRFNLYAELQRLDDLSGIGQCGIMVLGVDDANASDLSSPVDGIDLKKATLSNVSKKDENDLLWIRCLDQTEFRVKSLIKDPLSPMFGMPEIYSITTLNPNSFTDSVSEVVTGTPSAPSTEVDVHWTRVLHAADQRKSSAYLGTPRMQPNYNRILDLEKILGADGEGFWRSGFPGISVETTPNVGFGELEEQFDELRKQLFMYHNGTAKSLILDGLTAKTLAPSISDPSPHVRTHLELITSTIGAPFRVFMGSEEAKLAGDADMKNWGRRLFKRQNKYLTYMVLGLAHKLTLMRVLNVPKRVSCTWRDPDEISLKDKTDIASKIITAMSYYISHGISALLGPLEFLTMMGFSIEDSQMFLEKLETYKGKTYTPIIPIPVNPAKNSGNPGNP